MPDKTRGEVGTETLEVDDRETTGGLHAKPGEAPVTTAAFSELECDSAMWLKEEERCKASWRRGLEQTVCRRERVVAMPRRGLGLGPTDGRRERREEVPRRGLDP